MAAVGYHAALLRGHVERAKVVRVEMARAKNKDLYFLVYERLSTKEQFREQIAKEDRHLLTDGRIIPINVVRIAGMDRVTLGAEPTLHAAAMVVPLALVIAALVGSVLTIRATRPWYDRRKLVEAEEGKVK